MCGNILRTASLTLVLLFLSFALSSYSLYAEDRVLEIYESELIELQSINERQKNRLELLETKLEQQEKMLEKQANTIERLETRTNLLWSLSENHLTTIRDLGTSFEEYTKEIRIKTWEDRIIYTGAGILIGGILSIVF